MASARSVFCGLKTGFIVRKCAGGFSIPVRGAVYNPSYVEPLGVDKEQLSKIADKPEVQEIIFRPIKATKSDVSNSIFYDPLLLKFTNLLMRNGNRTQATELMHRALYSVKLMKPKSGSNPLDILEKAIANAAPVIETAQVKRGGQFYAVPVPMTPNRSRFVAMKWLLEAASDKERHVRFHDQLAKELVDASNNVGRVIKKKQESHKTAEANKAYAHYRYS